MILDFEIKQVIKIYKLLYEDHYTFSVPTFMKEMSNIFVYKLLCKKSNTKYFWEKLILED